MLTFCVLYYIFRFFSYTYIYTCLYMYIYVYIYTQTYTYIRVCACVCARACLGVCMCVCVSKLYIIYSNIIFTKKIFIRLLFHFCGLIYLALFFFLQNVVKVQSYARCRSKITARTCSEHGEILVFRFIYSLQYIYLLTLHI